MPSSSIQIAPGAQPFFFPGDSTGILIIHGYGGSIGDYRDFGNQLHRFGYTVMGMRLAGHGQNLPILKQATIADWQQSVDEAIDHIRQQCQNIVIVGSSFGGVLALDAVRRKKTIHGLVVVNTALSYRGGGAMQGFLLRLLRLFTPYYPKFGMSGAERRRGREVGSSPAWPINGILATAKFSRQNIIPVLPTIQIPVLIVSSSNDPIVGTENGSVLIANLGSTIKSTIVVPVATHRPFRDIAATAFLAEQTHAFIQQHLA